jgi:hypothetical protein
LLWLAAIVAAAAFLSGLVWEKIASWFVYGRLASSDPLEELTTGIVPPLVEASVLSNTDLNGSRLLYKGVLHAIQIGPEGRIDHIILSKPTKSLLLPEVQNTADQDPRPTIPKTHTFVDIGSDETPPGRRDKKPLLLLESEDIANVYFRSKQNGGRAGILDQWMLQLLTRLGLAGSPEPPAQSGSISVSHIPPPAEPPPRG